MADPNLTAVVECLQNAREEIEATFKRTFDTEFQIASTENLQKLEDIGTLTSELACRSLLVEFSLSGFKLQLWLPDPAGLIPIWADNPDATGKSRLATLAQELGILLLPPEWPLFESTARITTGFTQGPQFHEATAIRVPLLVAGQELSLIVVLGRTPSARPDVGGAEVKSGADRPSVEKSPAASNRLFTETSSSVAPHRMQDFRAKVLPLLTRSLLRIRLPAEVILARTRKPLLEILQMAPGTIIQFDKSCEEPLDLAINGHVIARGEAVKVGDKFGLRILEMTLPRERYIVLSARTRHQPSEIRHSSTISTIK